MEPFLLLVVRFFRYSLLFVIIPLAATFWGLEVIFSAIARHSRSGAIGASLIIKAWANVHAKLFSWLRRCLGRYVSNHHPRIYHTLLVLFQ